MLKLLLPDHLVEHTSTFEDISVGYICLWTSQHSYKENVQRFVEEATKMYAGEINVDDAELKKWTTLDVYQIIE